MSLIFIFRPLEEMFVRDALFKIEIEDKVLLSAYDIENGIVKRRLSLYANPIHTGFSNHLRSLQ
jgi:hypothetical protein